MLLSALARDLDKVIAPLGAPAGQLVEFDSLEIRRQGPPISCDFISHHQV